MDDVRKQFTFYRSYYESLLPLPKENQAAILLAVCAYALYETEPQDLTPVELMAFNLIRPTLDTARKKAQNGKKGGEGKGKQAGNKANRKQAESNHEANRKLEREGEREGERVRERERVRVREGILYPPISPFYGQNGLETVAKVWRDILDLYPRDHIDNPAQAENAFDAAVDSEETAAEMLDSLEQWKSSEQWAKEGGRYIPMLVNWIRNGIWKTRPAKMRTCNGASGELGQAELEAIHRLIGADKEEKA